MSALVDLEHAVHQSIALHSLMNYAMVVPESWQAIESDAERYGLNCLVGTVRAELHEAFNHVHEEAMKDRKQSEQELQHLKETCGELTRQRDALKAERDELRRVMKTSFAQELREELRNPREGGAS